MKKLAAVFVIAVVGVCAAVPAQARDHLAIGIGLGGCCAYYPGYYYDPYWAPPPVYYQPAPSVVYAAPPQTVYVQQPPQTVYVQPPAQQQPSSYPPAMTTTAAAPSAAPVSQVKSAPTSSAPETYTDDQGRTCRAFEATLSDGVPVKGKACLQEDGTWHTVE